MSENETDPVQASIARMQALAAKRPAPPPKPEAPVMPPLQRSARKPRERLSQGALAVFAEQARNRRLGEDIAEERTQESFKGTLGEHKG